MEKLIFTKVDDSKRKKPRRPDKCSACKEYKMFLTHKSNGVRKPFKGSKGQTLYCTEVIHRHTCKGCGRVFDAECFWGIFQDLGM
jgi:hypothetical protein